MKKIFGGLFVLLCALSLFACDFSEKEQFGRFTHNGYSLTTFKTSDITYTEANKIVSSNSIFVNLTPYNLSTYSSSFGQVLTTSEIEEIKNIYSSVTVVTKYWNDTTQYTKTDNVPMYEMESILTNNYYTVVTGMLVNNIVLTEDLLSYYNQINSNFISSAGYSNAPFKNRYSYHTNSDNLLVLRVNDYSSNNSSSTGTSTMEIHETETQYDENNMISLYQASFGFQYPTPGDTTHIGTVLEVSFTWNLKV